jgi:hypothetical protein
MDLLLRRHGNSTRAAVGQRTIKRGRGQGGCRAGAVWPGRAAVAVGYSVPAGAASGQEESVESFCAEDVTAELRYGIGQTLFLPACRWLGT